MEILFISHSS